MSSLGYRDILLREGIHPPITLRVNGAAEVFPGYAVTCTGHTYPDCGKPDAIRESVIGVAGLLENQDIGVVYADDAEIPVYLCGSGAMVKMYHAKNGGSVVAGDLMVAQAEDDTGFVEPLTKAMGDAIAALEVATVVATQITHIFSLVGRALETHASTGTTTPIKVILSV